MPSAGSSVRYFGQHKQNPRGAHDYRLGDKNGVYFIETLREEFNENIPACIVTADTAPQHLDLFKELHIEVLYKPIDIHSIAEFIASRIN